MDGQGRLLRAQAQAHRLHRRHLRNRIAEGLRQHARDPGAAQRSARTDVEGRHPHGTGLIGRVVRGDGPRVRGRQSRSLTAAARDLISRSGCPIPTTRLIGILKEVIGLSALRDIQANRRSRHSAIPGTVLGMTVSRLKKKEVSARLKGLQIAPQRVKASGMSMSSMKPYLTLSQ